METTFSRNQRTGIALLTALSIALGIVVVWLVRDGQATSIRPPGWETPGPSTCTNVRILGGQARSPYTRYSETLAELVNNPELNGGKDWSAQVDTSSSGAMANIQELEDGPVCTLAMTQFNLAVDAREGVFLFAGRPVEDLRLVGQIYYDLVHLIVPTDSDITQISDLCGKRVLVGRPESGTLQIGLTLIERVQEEQKCDVLEETDTGLVNSLPQLFSNGPDRVDAVFWAAGAPSEDIEYFGQTHAIRMVPLDEWRDPTWENFRTFYEEKGLPAGGVTLFAQKDFIPADYGLEQTGTFGTPNGIVATKDTDPALVEFVTQVIDMFRPNLQENLWNDSHGRSFATPTEFLGSNICRLVPLHPDADRYYRRELGQPTGCPPA